MKLSKLGFMALRGDRELKKKVAAAVGVTENTIYYWVKNESDNLTKMACLQVIAQETGLSIEQLLEETNRQITTEAA